MRSEIDSYNDLAPSAREEIEYWALELKLEGVHAQSLRDRLDPTRRTLQYPAALLDPLVELLRERFRLVGRVRCVELGSGPVSSLAAGVDSGHLDVTAVDVLADQYAELRGQYQFEDYPVQPIAGTGEALLEAVEEDWAHVTFVANALDHVDDLPLVFDNLVRATKRGGFIVLIHFLDEASHSEWSDAHKWNLNLGARGLAAVNTTGEQFQLGGREDLDLRFVSYRSISDHRGIDVVYERR